MIRYTVADKDSEKYLKRLIGRRDLEDALMRLDRLTQEEAWMATAQVLKVAHRVEGGVKTVAEQVEGVGGQVKGVDGKVDVAIDKVDVALDKVDVAIQGTFGTLLTHKRDRNSNATRRQGNEGSRATDGKRYGRN